MYLTYFFIFLLVDMHVGKCQIANCEGEHRNRNGEAIEKSSHYLLIVQSGNHQVRLETRVETSKIVSSHSVGFGKL